MVTLTSGKFKCRLLTPQGVILDCNAGSLILPGHDGLFGVLRNHAPMLYKLGIGIMQVKNITGKPEAFFLVDGGFARISENNVTVLAYDVTNFLDMEKAEAEELLTQARQIVVGRAYIQHQAKSTITRQKAELLVKLGKMSAILDTN